MAGVSIESLKLSVRATNVLHRMGIFEVEQLLNTPIEQIADQRNIGIKTITEIRSIVNQIIAGDVYGWDVPNTDNSKAGKRIYSEEQIEELSRHFITELNLSNRAINALMRIGCNTLDKLALMTEEDIKNLKGLGTKTCKEMLCKLQQWSEANVFFAEDDESIDDISTEELDFYKELARQISPIVRIYWKQLRNIVHESGQSDVIESAKSGFVSADCISKVLNITEFEQSLKNLFLRFVPDGIIKVEDMAATFTSLDLEFDINILIGKISDGAICTVKDEYCYLNRLHVMQYVMENCSNSGDRNKEIISRRMQGENLQTIGDSYGLSRERVRQIFTKTIKTFPLMYAMSFS